MSPDYSTETNHHSGIWAEGTGSMEDRAPFPWESRAPAPTGASPHQLAARGFGQIFGIHPIPTFTTLTVNAMLFGGTIVTMGALLPLAIVVAAILGFIVYKAQRRFYLDDHDAALIKALAVGLITAIPVGLPTLLTVPSGVVGLVHTLRRKP
jgi:hypothetical protein